MIRRVGQAGFTIVETMVVIAVIGALFVMIAGTLSGRQRKSQFTVAINGMQNQIQQLISETNNGFAPGGNLSCTVSAGKPQITASADSQGTNGACVFFGNALRLGGGSAEYPNPYESYTIYPLAAPREIAGNQLLDPTTARFAVIAPGVTTNPAAPIRQQAKATLFGLQYKWLQYKLTSGGSATISQATPSFIVFASKNTTSDTPGDTNSSGGEQLGMYWVNGGPNGTEGSEKLAIDKLNGATIQQLGSVKLCFGSGTTDQSGLISIGDNGSLVTDIKIYDGTTCGAP